MGGTVVVAVRIPERVKREIEALGLKVSEFAREAMMEALARKKSEEALRWVEANMVQGNEVGFDSTEVIRKMRETM
ncbi:hypothetical protein KEJ49_04475 [Candidatus Bathyarchaeota archaeon]|nr:hypothetical protein [Candidatus Bathyarchaeota archaeon]